jgi:dienelactone hydrolase
MRHFLSASFAALAISHSSAALVTRPVDYKDEKGTPLHGFVVYDGAVSGPRPGVIVVHDWRGVSDYAHARAEMVAKLGYTAFIADIYGKDVSKDGPQVWMQQVGTYKGDRALYRQRARAAYEASLKVPQIDPKRIAAIGYCFGGTGVIEMARDGLPLKGVVPFHGGLDAQPLTPGKTITAKVLALCGADDPFEKAEDMAAFEKQLKDDNVDYQIVFYGHAVHAFTEPDVDELHIQGVSYNATADKRSWQAMVDFLKEIFQ